MSGRLRRCSSHERTALTEGWEFAAGAGAPGADPAAAGAGLRWSRAHVPGTVAASLRAANAWSLEAAPRAFDAEEWWYRIRFDAEPVAPAERVVLGLDGLATLAEVWLNGMLVCTSANMFVEHRLDVSGLLSARNELVIRFAALEAFLQARRQRPRWRTPMVSHQQMRWVRTTLLGRTPGWSPPAAAVGPWRPAWLERRRLIDIGDLRLQATVSEAGDSGRGQAPCGRLTLSCEIAPLGGALLQSARIIAERDGQRFEADVPLADAAERLQGALSLPDVALWWPHTHGAAPLYGVHLQLVVQDPQAARAETVEADLGSVGFRDLRLERDGGDFAVSVNGRAVFCRGACWTPLDVVSLQASPEDYREALEAVRDAGMNMLRVCGPLVYESDSFLDLCDSHGILLWQDFMFANMDYPAGDAAFHASVEIEARQQLARLQARPALAILCGNSEGAQQAAMSGAPRECWAPPLFESQLAALAREYAPAVPYSASSTHGGAFPHQANAGVTSYYGVGAYRLPLTDARRSQLRFASECLAFANVPENETLLALSQGQALRVHHPRWKERVPRDQGAGWDFDDVRDHYLALLYRTDVLSLRYGDHDRYLRLGRAASGECMAASFAEWRRAGSRCRGALLWFLRDLWAGAGWGVIDATGLPKAAYYYLKRVMQPLALIVTDEGTNGLAIHIVNDAPACARLRLEVRLFRHSEPLGPVARQVLNLEAGSATALAATDLQEGFVDLSYAYRFGPPPYEVLHAQLIRDEEEPAPGGMALAEAFHFPLGLPNGQEGDVGLSATATPGEGGAWDLRIQCRKFAQSVHVEAPGFVADDQYFHMAPKSTRHVRLRRRPSADPAIAEATVHALNAAASCRVVINP
jgi:beta-mannosidase